jgi:hypothetical protein
VLQNKLCSDVTCANIKNYQAHNMPTFLLTALLPWEEVACSRSHLPTVAHFCHIWSLHGVQEFTLIEGIVAFLHLHSAISSACKKISRWRNAPSIAGDLQGLFPSNQEFCKASLAGDVCCICLGTMLRGGHVKKVHYGHLYQTHR